METANRAVRIFNKFFAGFLRDLKEIHDDIRVKVKSTYKVIDKSSSQYYNFFKDNMYKVRTSLVSETFESEDLQCSYVCENVKFNEVMTLCNEEQNNNVLNYLFILMLFAYVSEIADNESLLEMVIDVLSKVQKGEEVSFDDILDDDVVSLIQLIKKYGGNTRVAADEANKDASKGFDSMDFFQKLNNSKIADIAKEISKDIDVSSIKAESPDDVLKSLFSASTGETNVLGNIIQKVSSTLNDKITKGELKHEDLLGEAMSMMNMFGNGAATNPLFAQMAKAMKSGKAGIRQDVLKKASVKDRLRKKLDDRKKESKNID